MSSLRPTGFDDLGLRRALSDRMLPLVVAAMAFLAALALAGWFATATLSRHWQQGAGSSLTIQVPRPTEPSAAGGETRLAAVLALLTGTPGVAAAHALSNQELITLLKPWLGQGTERLAIPMPGVIAVRLTDDAVALEPLSRRLGAAAPGVLVEDHEPWIRRLGVLVRSLQACAGLALLLVAGIAAAVISVATRAGLSTRRETIEIIYGLGATDRYIAGRFAARVTVLAAAGSAGGALASLPVLLTLAHMAAPFTGDTMPAEASWRGVLGALPMPLWLTLPCLPAGAAVIGYTTAHGAVRHWLQRLP